MQAYAVRGTTPVAFASLVVIGFLAVPVLTSHGQTRSTPSRSTQKVDIGTELADDKAAKVADDGGDSKQDATSDGTDQSPLTYIAPKPIEMLIGLRITAGDGNMISTTAQTVFPTNWPEQTVEVVEVNVPGSMSSQFRELPGNNQQLLFFAPVVTANSTVEATVRVRITKSHTVGPQETAQFRIAKRHPKDIKQFLGNSPYIEADSSEIRKIVKEIDATEPLTDWKKVEALYDWVRENIVYVNGDLKTVREALRDRKGDCEEMTSTFVALCRAARIPARVVWIPNHCYPEFYLEDAEGKGHWFPCQVAGTRNFGSMPEYLPILQKGDRFKVPERQELQRYLADYLSSKKVLGRSDPQVEFIRQLLGEAAQLRAPEPGDISPSDPASEDANAGDATPEGDRNGP